MRARARPSLRTVPSAFAVRRGPAECRPGSSPAPVKPGTKLLVKSLVKGYAASGARALPEPQARTPILVESPSPVKLRMMLVKEAGQSARRAPTRGRPAFERWSNRPERSNGEPQRSKEPVEAQGRTEANTGQTADTGQTANDTGQRSRSNKHRARSLEPECCAPKCVRLCL